MSKSHASLLPKSEDQIKAVFDTLSEKDRRRYVASLSLLLPHGGCTYLSELLKCSLSTIYRGRRELQQLEQEGDPADGRIRREGAGRPKKEDDHPELVKALEEILDERTAGSPTQQTVRWTWLTVSAITKRLCEVCTFVSRPVVARLCRALNLKKRQQVKSVTKAPSRNRNEQFGIIDRLREEFRRTKDAIFSVDSKQKELLGKVFRPGMVLADGPVEVLDHALPSYAQGEVITHGIYDPQLNRAHMNLNTSHDTGEFACASLRWFWQNLGRHWHALADRILLLLDCGGSNSFRSNVFKSHLSRLSTQIGLPIQVAHLPVYCSKYNPIERRVFPWVEQAYSGRLFTDVRQMANAIENTARTSTGLQTSAHVMKNTFTPATKRQQKQAANVQVEYPEPLTDYNYRVVPDNCQ